MGFMRKAVTDYLPELRNNAPALLRDTIGIVGAASFAYGAWLAWHPAGYMMAGAMAMAGAYLHAKAA